MDINKIVQYSQYINLTPVPFLIKPFYQGLGSILLFHNIAPQNSGQQLKNGSYNRTITPEKLEEIILFFKKRNYQFISMDELSENLIQRKNSGKFVVFTLDDGMFDNFKYAFPVFKKHNVPFIIYLPAKFIGSDDSNWAVVLEYFVKAKDEIRLSGAFGERIVNIQTNTQKDKVLRELIDLTENNLEYKDLEKLFCTNNWEGFKHSERSYLNWDEVREMAKDTICTIGSHSVNHSMLSRISDALLNYELTESRKIIENEIQKPVLHFSYPHGTLVAAGKREFDSAKKAGYKTGTTVRYANIHHEHSEYLHCLPRYTIKPYFTSRHLAMISSGTFQFIVNKSKRIVAEN